MNIIRIFTLSVIVLIGQHAMAADLTERTMPATPDFGPGQLTASDFETVAADFELGACYVLYHVGSQAYFGEGNAWGTQASVTKDTPLLVRFTLPEGKTLDDAALLFNDYSNAKNAWKFVFFDNVTQMYVDLGSQANYFWQVLPTDGDKTYRLQASLLNPQYNPTSCPGFVGLDVSSNQENTALSPFLDEGDGHYLDWQFFAVPAWTQYFKEKDVYDKAQLLKTLIGKAESIGCDVSAAVAVYNNLDATLEQLQQAFDSMHAAIIAKMAEGTAVQPGDGTLLIENPNFDNASADGWRGDKPNMVGSGSHGPADVAEFYNRVFDTYQTIDGLSDGVYALRANTLFRGSMEDMQNGTESAAKLYATVGEEMTTAPFINVWAARNMEPLTGETLSCATPWGTTATETSAKDQTFGYTYYIPNDPSAARLYFEKGFYQNVLFFEVSGGKVRLGTRNDARSEGSDNWAVFDSFTLSYYGNTQESYQAWAAQGVPVYEIPEGAVYTWAYADAYQETLTSKATNKTEALAAVSEARTRLTDLQVNILAWRHYVEICDRVAERLDYYKKTYPQAPWNIEVAHEIEEYMANTYQQNLSARELTNEQLQEEYIKVYNLNDQLWVIINNYITSVGNLTIPHDGIVGSSPIFDLQGRRLSGKPERGMYIQDGKKRIVK